MKFRNLLAFCYIALCFACDDPKLESRPFPSVDTIEATDITEDGAALHGEILSLGTAGIKDYGFLYADHQGLGLTNSNFISLGKSPQEGKFSAIADRNLPKTGSKGKLCYFATYAITNDGLIVYGQEKSFASLGAKPPVIKEMIPATGFVSDTVRITGSGFSNYTLNNKVLFDNYAARVLSSNGDTIWCIVPATNPGVLKVRVAVDDNTTASKDFQVPTTTFTSFTPEFVSPGDTVYLNGSNFPSLRSSMEVTFLGRAPKAVSSTPAQLKVVVPDNVTLTSSSIQFSLGLVVIESETEIKLKP